MKFITNSLTIHDSVVMVVILCCLGLKPPSPYYPAQCTAPSDYNPIDRLP